MIVPSLADLATYAAICRRTFTDTYHTSHDATALARHVEATFGDDRLALELTGRRVLVVTCDDAWVGYVLLSAGSAPDGVVGQRPVEVARFYVEAAWQGRGVAAPLMDGVLAMGRADGHDVAWLAVWEQNSRAIRFYHRMGFRIVGHSTYAFDGHAENDHVMARPIL